MLQGLLLLMLAPTSCGGGNVGEDGAESTDGGERRDSGPVAPSDLGDAPHDAADGGPERQSDEGIPGPDAAPADTGRADGAVPACEGAATFVGQQVPAEVVVGATFDVAITMRNDGPHPWSEAAGYRLGSQDPQDNEIWGAGRVPLPAEVEVAPGATHTFAATLRAPEQGGTYAMSWRLVQEHVCWFGDPTPTVLVDVSAGCVDHCANRQLDCGEEGLDCGGPDCTPCGPVVLSPPGAELRYPHVVAPDVDRVLVVWEQASGRVQYTCGDGRAFGPPADIPGAAGQRARLEQNIRLAAGPTGRVHASWSSGGGSGRKVFWAAWEGSCEGGAWGPPEEVTARDVPERSSPFPSIGVDELDRPWVMWSHAKHPTTSAACDEGDDCCTGLDDCLPGDMVCAGGRCVPEVYRQHISVRTADGWSEPVDLTRGRDALSHHGALHVRAANDVHAVFLHAWPDPGQRKIFWAHFDGERWRAPEFTGLTNSHCPDVRADERSVHVLANPVRYVRRAGDGGWQRPVTQVARGYLDFVSLRQDGAGGLHAVWVAGDDELRVHTARADAASGQWGPERRLVDMPDAQAPVLAIDPAGAAHVVFSRCGRAGCPGHGDYGAVYWVRTVLPAE